MTDMRVRKAAIEELDARRMVAARYADLARSPDDEGFECPGCGFVLVVTLSVAGDSRASFCCPMCGTKCVRAE